MTNTRINRTRLEKAGIKAYGEPKKDFVKTARRALAYPARLAKKWERGREKAREKQIEVTRKELAEQKKRLSREEVLAKQQERLESQKEALKKAKAKTSAFGKLKEKFDEILEARKKETELKQKQRIENLKAEKQRLEALKVQRAEEADLVKQELELKEARKELGEETFGEFIKGVPSKVKAGFAKVGEMRKDISEWQDKIRDEGFEKTGEKSLAQLQDEELKKDMQRENAEMKAQEAETKAEELEIKREEAEMRRDEARMKKESEHMRAMTQRTLKLGRKKRSPQK